MFMSLGFGIIGSYFHSTNVFKYLLHTKSCSKALEK